MSALRYINDVNVQGWEPVPQGRADASLTALELPSNFGFPPNAKHLTSRRQAPLTRARAATCPDIHDSTFMPRSGSGAFQQTPCASGSAYRSATESRVSSSARNAAAAGRSGSRPRSSTERKIARKLAENANYVPRPKNSFILFRTEFVAQRTAGGDNSDGSGSTNASDHRGDEDEDEASQSLSKQASAVWNKMSEAEKRPWAERAKLEKAAHEAKYPNYRYKPVRHSSAARKSGSVAPSSASHSPMGRPSLSLERTSSASSSTLQTDTEDGLSPISSIDEDRRSESSYYSTAASSSTTTLDTTFHEPAFMRKLSLPDALPSSSALANALGSQSANPAPGSPASGPALPTVPPVPVLTFREPGSSRMSRLPPIPRSPSAPVFDRHVVGQIPYQRQQQYLAAPPLHLPHTQNSDSSLATSAFAVNQSGTSSDGPSTTSPLSSEVGPTPESSDSNYFRNVVQHGPDDSNSTCSYLTDQQFITNNDIYYEKLNGDNTHHEMDEMDIDMLSLLNLSPVPEVPEPTNTDRDAQRPFDAIAALWVQDQQRTHESTCETPTVETPHLQPKNRIQMQDSPKGSSSTFASPASVNQEIGLDTYALAVGGDFFSNCTANTCSDDGDFFRLDYDLRPASSFGCAGTSPLSFSSLGGGGDALNSSDDIFGYDRERGLCGLYGTEHGAGTGTGFGLDYTFF